MMEPVTIAPGLNVKQIQGAATAVKWREPVVGFPARSFEDTDSKLNGSQLTQTTMRENDSSTLANGVPSSVVVVPQNDVYHSQTDIDSNANRATIQSRARARRSDEPAPFLCIDNLPMDKVIVDGKTSASPAVRKPPPPSSRKYQDFETAPPTSSSSTTRKGSAAIQSPGPPRATPKSTPRNTPSAGFYNYNSFFTHKNPAFLAGPPNLWSLNNRFWPHATPPLDKSNLPPLPSALSLEAATLRQNSQVIQPFKHGPEPVIHKVNERASSPSYELKAQTVKAIHDVTRQISKQSSSTSVKPSGRLLKGKLQPLHTFKMDGPVIEKCQGIQPEGTSRSYTPSQSRLLQRKRELLNMLPPDIFQTRPQTQESIHRTSVASNWDETRYNDLESDLGKADIDSQQFGQPSRLSTHDEVQLPSNPTDQITAGERIKPTIPERTDEGEIKVPATSPRLDSSSVGGDNGLSSQSMSELMLASGGASQILCRMIDRVKVNSATSDPGVMPTDQTNSNDPTDQKDNDADHRKMREKLKRAKSEPVLSVGRMTLASHVFRGHDQLGSSFDEQTVENRISEEFPASEMFDISAGGNNAVRHSRTGINIKQVTESPSKETTLSLQVSQGKDENSAQEEGETSKNGGEELRSADLEKAVQVGGHKTGSKFFISETSDIDRDSVRGRSPAVREIHVGDSPSGNVKEYEVGKVGNSSEIGSQELSRNDEESKQEKMTENSARGKKESCKDEDSLRSKSRDDDDKDGGDGDGCRHETGVHRGVEGTGQGSQGGGNDGNQQQNYNNSGQGKQAVNQSDLEDVPDLDEAVLFCSYCDQDIDECQCVYSQERNSQREMSFKELALVSRYERILSAAGGEATHSEVDEGRSQIPGSGKKTRPRPESAPCGMTGTMMVMRGTGLQSKEISPNDNQSRVEIVKGRAKMKSALNSPARDVDNMTIVASTKPRHDRSGAEQGPMIPPMGFKVNARPPDGTVYFFAYGMEMNAARLQAYTGQMQNHRMWGILYGFQMQFNRRGMELSAGGFPNIIHSPENSVEGCIYCLSLEQMALLDNAVGCPKFCIKVVLPVWMINCMEPDKLGVAQYCIPAVMYIARDTWVHSEPLCNSYNLQQCLVGADLLSPLYQAHLQSLMCTCCM